MVKTSPVSLITTIPFSWRIGFCLICLLWLFAGSLGHDPWRPDDAIHLGVAFGMGNGQWLIPRIAGDPWLTTPPLYHWLATLCGWLFGWLLPWHDAARLASPLLSLTFLALLSTTARRLADSNAALLAPILAIGTLGFLLPLHDANPAILAVVGYALSLFGLARWREQPLAGGVWLGAGIGVGFLGAGLDGLLAPLLTGLAIFCHPTWRQRGSLPAGLLATVLALLLILPWPWLLHQRSPVLFALWWSAEIGNIAPKGFTRAHLEMLLWASWPLLPLALWQLWLERRRLWQAQTCLPLLGASLSLLVFFSIDARPEALLPALAPLALLAASGCGRLRRGAANAFDWFGAMTFSLLIALVWLSTYAMLTGTPERIAKNFTKPAPGFIAHIPVTLLILGGVATLIWLALLFRMPRSPWRATLRWSLGLTAVWMLLAMFWLPWVDYGKTYRGVSAEFSQLLGDGCIARRNLGLAQRASFDYFNGIRTVEGERAKSCRYLIQQAPPKSTTDLPGWRLLRETSRPGDKKERLRLYRRD